MKQTLLIIFLGSLLIASCNKKDGLPETPQAETCLQQKNNPAGTSYEDKEMIPVSYSKKNCGLLPLSRTNYWVYEDSVYSNGNFVRVKYDTLRFTKTYESAPDKLIWWEANKEIGLPALLYSNDSVIFLAEYSYLAADTRYAKKEFSLFEGDSLRYLTSFSDNAAMGRSVKLNDAVITAAGNFKDCILYEKKAPFFRKDQVIYKPGLGVIKYISEQAQAGSPALKMHQISTLVSYHIN